MFFLFHVLIIQMKKYTFRCADWAPRKMTLSFLNWRRFFPNFRTTNKRTIQTVSNNISTFFCESTQTIPPTSLDYVWNQPWYSFNSRNSPSSSLLFVSKKNLQSALSKLLLKSTFPMFLSQIHVVTGVKSLIPTFHIQTCGSSRVIYLSGIRCRQGL